MGIAAKSYITSFPKPSALLANPVVVPPRASCATYPGAEYPRDKLPGSGHRLCTRWEGDGFLLSFVVVGLGVGAFVIVASISIP